MCLDYSCMRSTRAARSTLQYFSFSTRTPLTPPLQAGGPSQEGRCGFRPHAVSLCKRAISSSPVHAGIRPAKLVAEDANFLRATGCYGDIYPLLQKRFSSAKVLTPVLGSYLRIRNTTLRFGTTPISLKVQPDGDRARRFPLWSRRPTK